MLNFKVFMLGASGAGKTTLLACKHHKLSTQGRDNLGFFIEVVGKDKLKKLTDLYTQIADPNADWIPGNRAADISEWTFKCCVMGTNGRKYAPLSFTYLDYSGGFVSDGPHSQRLQAELDRASAIVGLIDGVSLLESMQSDYSKKFAEQLMNICCFMQTASHPSTEVIPLHYFVITKWDVLRKENIGLSEVEDHLMDFYPFFNLVKSNEDRNHFVRIIPVSALGDSYVDRVEGNKMQKLAGGFLSPYNVEVPIACIIPDLIVKTNVWNPNKSYSRFMGQIKYLLFDIIPDFIPNDYGLSKKFIRSVSAYVKEQLDNAKEDTEGSFEPQRRSTAQKKKSLKEAIKFIRNDKTALQYIIKCFLDIHYEATQFR